MAEITVTGIGGEYMEAVVVVAWHKNVGDKVMQGDLIVTVETAKAATEIEATEAGILTQIRAQIGEEVPIGAVLGVIGDTQSQEQPTTEMPQETPSELEPTKTLSEQPVVTSGRVIASPLARRVARQKNIDLGRLTPSSPTGRIKLRDLEKGAHEGAQASIHIQHVAAADKPKIVLLHGFGSDSSSWNPLLVALGNRFDCYLVDMPGHGRSYLPKTVINVRQMAQDIARALPSRGLDHFHLVGHSLGGAVALALIEMAKFSVLSLTLLAPAGLGAEINGDFITGFTRATQSASLQPWLEKLFFNPQHVTPALVEATGQARTNAALRLAQSSLAQHVFPDGTQATNLRPVLQQLKCPQKIIWGMQDQILPMRQAFNLGAHAGLHMLPDIGHMPHYEAPSVVAHLLRQNINSADHQGE